MVLSVLASKMLALLSLWICAPAVCQSQQDANADRSSCHIQSDPQPRYVAAFSLNYQPGRGCYSNGSSPSHQLVHVINLKLEQDSDDDVTRRTVTLRTEPRNFTSSQGFTEEDEYYPHQQQQQLVFVLNSQHPVKWKVDVSGQFPLQTRHLFLNYQTPVSASRRRIRPTKYEDFEVTNIIDRHEVRNTRGFQLPAYNTKQYQNSFFVRTVEDWNHLEENIVKAGSASAIYISAEQVQSHSTIRFKKRKVQGVRGRRRSMPSAEDEHFFLSWVKRKFKAVTSYSEVDGDKVLFYVGQVEKTGSECRLNEMEPSPYALSAHLEEQSVSGCVSLDTQVALHRPVYVVELGGVTSTPLDTQGARVELDIRPAGGQRVDHNFYLVLRSPPATRWLLRSQNVHGWIDVITDADVDLRGIRMHTVALRREVMEASGVDLVRWAEYYVAPVRAYASVSSANVLQLLLPSHDNARPSVWVEDSLDQWDATDTEEEDTDASSPATQTEDTTAEMRDHLKRIIHTRCKGGVMEVALPILLTQELDLSVQELSLLDPGCQAKENGSHVILRTALNECGTSKMIMDDEEVYSNAIVMETSSMVAAILDGELGSGYFDLQAPSGSGWPEGRAVDAADRGAYADDEDFATHIVHIDVECRIALPEGDGHMSWDGQDREAGRDERGRCELTVYDDPLLVLPVKQFPHAVRSTAGLRIQASSPDDPSLSVMIERCWVSQWANHRHRDSQEIVLVRRGCPRSPGVTFLPDQGQGGDREWSPWRLLIQRSMPAGSYLHCRLACCDRRSCLAGCQCPSEPANDCDPEDTSVYPWQQSRPCGVHTVGPLEITDDRKVTGGSTRSGSDASRPSQGQGQLQQSIIIEGLDSNTVVGIAFAAFAIGILLTAALWVIHSHTAGSGKRRMVASHLDISPNSSPLST